MPTRIALALLRVSELRIFLKEVLPMLLRPSDIYFMPKRKIASPPKVPKITD